LSKGWIHRLGQRLPWYSPGNTLEGRNVRNLYAETTWFGLLSGLAATFVSVYALRMGATTPQVGWLTALPALVNVVWLIPAARLIERQRKRMPLILISGLLQRLGYLAMALMPFLIVTGRVQALIVLNAVVTLPAAIISTAITALLPDLASPDKRGQVISVRWLILAATATVAALVGGRFLDLLPPPLNYQILLGGGAALSMLSLVYLRRMRVPDHPLGTGPARKLARTKGIPARADRLRPAVSGWARLRHRQGSGLPSAPCGAPLPLRWPTRQGRQALGTPQGMAGILAHREFTRFAIASFVLYWGLYLPGALWSVLRVRDLGASDGWIGLIAVVVDGATIAGYFLWGKVRAKRGDRWVLLVTGLGVTVYAAITALVPTIGWMIPTSILGGLTWSGCNLALFNVMLGVCPGDRRASYVALYTALLNVAAFGGPLLGTALADGIGIRWTFVLSGGVRLAGVALFAVLLRKTKQAPRPPRFSESSGVLR